MSTLLTVALGYGLWAQSKSSFEIALDFSYYIKPIPHTSKCRRHDPIAHT